MKKYTKFFATALVLLGIDTVYAATSTGVVGRGISKNTTNTTTATQAAPQTATQTADNSRQTVNNSRNTSTVSRVARTATPNVVSRGATTTPAVQSSRSATTTSRVNTGTVASRATTTTSANVKTPTAPTTVSRSAVSVNSNTNISRSANAKVQVSRNASALDIIKNEDSYTKCREIFYECMDEFCANKDADLKRCACSSRMTEFENMQKQIDLFEEELNNFSARLLTVSMDAEDAMAISSATAGELAFNQTDNSESAGILSEISDRLKSQTSTSSSGPNLSAISLSLNVDSAFDNVDFMMGADTVLKEGTDLYNAILPTCIEIASEVCTSDDAIELAQSGYQMLIEQDCNLVSNAYETIQSKAADQVREGSALLDMSRLDNHQQRNSDDILTCKKKMLDTMYSSSVCGTDLSKCLDTTGQYIDPSTGAAFLTPELSNLSNLIVRPSGSASWTSVAGNLSFVNYLESKQMYLETATENCEDVADLVWDDFIEDALAQIKLAQDAKIEEMRQSCTTLTAECLTNNFDSITDFDSRALSIFGVWADKTVNEMCSSVKTSCTALLENTGGGDLDWSTGMDNISIDNTYATMMQTCLQVGKSCFTQACESISGNFGLCEDIDGSPKRHSLLQREICWDEVQECVITAGADKIDSIFEMYAENDAFYHDLYTDYNATTASNCESSDDTVCIYDLCSGKSGYELQTCRLTEKIWGNCEYKETNITRDENRILEPDTNTETLLSWFAENTNTDAYDYSCRVRPCPDGFALSNGMCVPADNVSDDGDVCAVLIEIIPNWTNCCSTGVLDSFGRCCENSAATYTDENGDEITICAPNVADPEIFWLYYSADLDANLFCIGEPGTAHPDDISYPSNFPSGDTYHCDGKLIWISNDNRYNNPDYDSISGHANDTNSYNVVSFYNLENESACNYTPNIENANVPTSSGCTPYYDLESFKIKYE